MSISVIPAPASTNLPATAAATASASAGATGEFAALLSGELLSLMGATEPNDTATGADSGEDTGDIADTSLLASLFGHPATETPARSLHLPASTTDNNGTQRETALISGRPALDSTPADQGLLRANSQDTSNTFEKLLQVSSNAASAQRSGAANIAGEGIASEASPLVANPVAATAAPGQAASPNGQPGSVNAHLHSAAWPQQFGDKIVWLARNDQQSAQLNINPPQLGPVQITLNLSGDQASIAFASPHAEVRQAIESAMPQLKEMLSSAGINLGQANVGANLAQQHAGNPFSDANGTRSTDENAILPANDKTAITAGTAVLHRGRGLVDLFA